MTTSAKSNSSILETSWKPPPLAGTAEFAVDARTGAIRQAGADGPGAFIQEFRALAERDLFAFAKGVLGYGLLNGTLHLPFCRWMQQIPPYRKLALLPRGHLKTTITKALMIHILIQPDGNNVYFPDGIGHLGHSEGTSTRILLASKTAKLAQSTLSEIMTILSTNPMIRGLWPQCVWDDPRRQAPHWNAERIDLPRRFVTKEASIETVGVGGQITGYHFNVHDFDDLIDLEDANSPTTMATAIDWFKASRALMDDQDHSLEYITGTRWAVHDLYEYIERNDPSVTIYLRRVIEDGQVIFPEAFNDAMIKRLQRELGPMFPLLYMNSAADPELTDFDMSMVRFFRIEGTDIVFDEIPADAMLAEQQTEAERLIYGDGVPPPIGEPLTDKTWDRLAARNQYIRFRHARAS